MNRYTAVLVCALAAMGCAGSLPSTQTDKPAPPLLVRATLLREDTVDHAVRPWRAEAVLQADESPVIEVSALETAYVSVVLYSARGESEDLAGSAPLRLSAGASKRFVVPRRAPPGVSETQLRLYITASSVPLAGAARGLLRLSCGAADDGGRGDRDGNGGSSSGSSSGGSGQSGQGSGDSGRAPDREKKGPGDAKVCPASTGLFPPITVIPIALQSK